MIALLVSNYLYCFFRVISGLNCTQLRYRIFYLHFNDGQSFLFNNLQIRNICSKLLTIDGSIEFSYSPKTSVVSIVTDCQLIGFCKNALISVFNAK